MFFFVCVKIFAHDRDEDDFIMIIQNNAKKSTRTTLSSPNRKHTKGSYSDNQVRDMLKAINLKTKTL